MRALIFAVVGVLASAAAITAPSRAAAPQVHDYLIAEVTRGEAGGTSFGAVDSLPVSLCISNDYWFCSQHQSESVTFPAINAASVGSTIWSDATDTGFANFTAAITNGVLDHLVVSLRPDVVIGWPGYQIVAEPDFFGTDVGPSGVDLSGYRVSAIGYRVDALTITHPFAGSTDFDVSGAFVFMGRVGSVQACMNGGWRQLVGPNGTFDNQGECIRTAVFPS